jgi:hypothetical protein
MDMSIDIASFMGGVIVAAGFHLYASRSKKVEDSVPEQDSQVDACSPEIRDELFSRVVSFFGDKNFLDLENAFVVV